MFTSVSSVSLPLVSCCCTLLLTYAGTYAISHLHTYAVQLHPVYLIDLLSHAELHKQRSSVSKNDRLKSRATSQVFEALASTIMSMVLWPQAHVKFSVLYTVSLHYQS